MNTIGVLGMDNSFVRLGAEGIVALWQLAFNTYLTRQGSLLATETIVQLILGEGCILFALHVAGDMCAREQEATTMLQVVGKRMLQMSRHTMERSVVAHDDGLLLTKNHIYYVIISNAIYSSHAGADIRIAHLSQCATVHGRIIKRITYCWMVHMVAMAHTPTAVIIGLPLVAFIKVIHLSDVVYALAIWYCVVIRTDTAIDTVLPPVWTTYAIETVDNQHLSFLLWRDIGR